MRDNDIRCLPKNEMNYPDYCFVDTAFGDVSHRNNVKRIDEIILPESPVECYTSMFRFTEKYKTHCGKTGSVRNIESFSCYCDYLWFDIDDDNLEDARIRCIDLLARIEAEFKVTTAVIFFSGSKGFHIGIPSELFGAEPRPELPRIFKKMAQDVAGDIRIDTAIYEKNRLWRLPNSINKRLGLFKIPLSYVELAQNDAGSIKKLASGRREIDQDTSIAQKRSEALSSLYDSIVSSLNQEEKQTDNKPNIDFSKINRPCIEKLLEGVEKGERNEVGIRLADHFKKQEHPLEGTVLILKKWNERNNPPLPETQIGAIVNSAYTGDYDYGCKDLILKAVCSSDCPLRREKKEKKPVYTSFAVLSDGTLLEMLYDKNAGSPTSFARFKDGRIDYVDSCRDLGTGIEYCPVKPGKIIRSNTIHFPSCAAEYGSESNLIRIVHEFIGKYLVVSPFFHTISTYYVLLSWVYDSFTVLPYLRVLGDYGTGKSRFLQTVGSLCYKPIFCTGAATVSPIFRLIDIYRGTVIIDESDFSDSDESHRIIKILNSGFQIGFPVLLTETVSSNRLEPSSFDVFGPKLIASRREFKDRALESRCITEIMDKIIPPGIPVNLPTTFWDEAREIRNMLLMWRFRKRGRITVADNCLDIPVEPRLAQIMIPLLSIIEDEKVKMGLIEFMRERNQQIIEERGETLYGKVAAATCELLAMSTNGTVRVKEIAVKVNGNLDNPKYEFTPRKAGQILRKTFNLSLDKDKQGYFLARTESNSKKLIQIAHKFGIEWDYPQESAQRAQCPPPVAGQQVMW